MKSLSFVLNIVSAMFAFTAAILWWQASVRLVRSNYDGPMASEYTAFHGGRGPVAVATNGEHFDVIPTLNLQSRLNSWAAKAAAVAAMFQGINALLPSPD